MAKRLTLHVTDEDAPIVERFKQSGGNLSELLREQLHRWNQLEAMRGDCELIELEMGEGVLNKSFYGNWIHKSLDPDNAIRVGVAHTRGGRFLVYYRDRDGRGTYEVHDTTDGIRELRLRHKVEAILTGGTEFMDI